MQINCKDLSDKLIIDFNYHDAQIVKVIKNSKDITFILKDGFNENQIDELNFINCEIEHQYPLEDRIIYQLDDLVKFHDSKWFMSFLVWTDNGLLEKILIDADNIISRKYEDNKYIENLGNSKNEVESNIKEIENIIGELTVDKLRDEKNQSLFNKIFNNKKHNILDDFNNYKLVKEEDLNNEVYK